MAMDDGRTGLSRVDRGFGNLFRGDRHEAAKTPTVSPRASDGAGDEGHHPVHGRRQHGGLRIEPRRLDGEGEAWRNSLRSPFSPVRSDDLCSFRCAAEHVTPLLLFPGLSLLSLAATLDPHASAPIACWAERPIAGRSMTIDGKTPGCRSIWLLITGNDGAFDSR